MTSASSLLVEVTNTKNESVDYSPNVAEHYQSRGSALKWT